MRCMTCGAESKPTAKFCETCGSPLQQTQQQAAWSAGQTNGQPAAATGQQPPQQGASVAQPSQTTYQAAYQATPDQGTPYQTPPYTIPPAPQPPQVKQASGAPFVLAIIALVAALLGLFPVSLVLAIIALAMNSGQKKRGEQSTKQTPTFVMGLISLILSIIMAVATLLLGGAVWLAFVDDGDDGSESTGASAVSSQPATTSSPAGVWAVVSWSDGEDVYDEEYLKAIEGMGVTVEVVLAEDGTASLDLFDEVETGTWEDRGSGKVALIFDGDTLEGAISGDEMTFSDDGISMVLRRTSAPAPATVGATAEPSSSAASSSSEPAASSSASSAESAKPAVRDATGEPTLGDFTWYAGAGGIPQGADILTSVYDVEGTWKAYVFGDVMERLCTVRIEAGQGGATATIDWLYVHDGSTDTGFTDDTPDEAFMGDWSGALGLDASGAGRLALTDFWQKGDHQYGMGTFTWPSGETDTVLLVRP